MKITVQVLGVQNVIQNVKASQQRIGTAVSRGLHRAGLLLQRESQLLVPVDFGVLKASAFTRAEGAGIKTVVTVGYTAIYALNVHENVAMAGLGLPRKAPSKGRYWDPPGSTAKFLEKPFRQFGPTLNKLVVAEVKKII